MSNKIEVFITFDNESNSEKYLLNIEFGENKLRGIEFSKIEGSGGEYFLFGQNDSEFHIEIAESEWESALFNARLDVLIEADKYRDEIEKFYENKFRYVYSKFLNIYIDFKASKALEIAVPIEYKKLVRNTVWIGNTPPPSYVPKAFICGGSRKIEVHRDV